MTALVISLLALAALAVVGLLMAIKIVKQYEQGVLFRLGRVLGAREPGCGSSSRSSTCCTGCRCGSSPCRSSPRASSPGTTSASTCRRSPTSGSSTP